MIRRLQRSDYPQVFELLKTFAKESGIKDLIKETYNYEQVEQVLLRCERGGISFVSQDIDRIQGFLLSIQVQDLWIKEVYRLKEVAWYVDPQFRKLGIGEKLFHAYVEAAENLRREHKITGYTMSKLQRSPRFNFQRQGFRRLETTYMKGL